MKAHSCALIKWVRTLIWAQRVFCDGALLHCGIAAKHQVQCEAPSSSRQLGLVDVAAGRDAAAGGGQTILTLGLVRRLLCG